MATKITATELSRNLSDILNRVRYHGEEFTIERNGQAIAVLQPPFERPKATGPTLAQIIRRHSPVDPKFADDLEEIQRSQLPFD